MRQTKPDKFAEWFNQVVPGAHRSITAQDVRDMIECGLIGKCVYFYRSDLLTVIAVFLYEQLLEERKQMARLKNAPKTCKRCNQPLLTQPDGKKRRPKEYCPDCEPYRVRDRYEDWKERHAVRS